MLIQRKQIYISSLPKSPEPEPKKLSLPATLPTLCDEECTALIINSSHEMAKEITLQLTLKMPGCSIMYAPTLEVAKWILKRRRVDLVVSSPILPDGGITKLKGALESLENPPDVVVVGDINLRNAEALSELGYEYRAYRKIGDDAAKPTEAPKREVLNSTVKNLGADIRNDLNNPLQEIVAMVFVAQATGRTEATGKALEAIDRAAKNMAQVVNGLEDKILNAVKPLSA